MIGIPTDRDSAGLDASRDLIPALGVRAPREQFEADEGTRSHDHDLGEGLKRGEPRAFEELVHRYGDYLYRVALRVAGSDAEARDALQDCFISAMHHVGEFEQRASLKTWLYRLTINAVLMRLRSVKQRNEVSMEELLPVLEGVREDTEWHYVESAEAGAARAQVRATVRASIARLPHNYRVVLVLRDIEGCDTKEVAALLNESEANIKVRLHRARAALRVLLEPLHRGRAP